MCVLKVDDKQPHITAIGISMYPNDGDDIDALMKNADIAMYKAKGAGAQQLPVLRGRHGRRAPSNA